MSSTHLIDAWNANGDVVIALERGWTQRKSCDLTAVLAGNLKIMS